MFLAKFKLTERSLKDLRVNGVPAETLQKLAKLKNQKPLSQTKFISLLQKTIGYNETARNQEAILRAAGTKPKHQRRIHAPSLTHYIWKVIQSTLLSAVMIFAIFLLDLLVKSLFPLDNPTVHLIEASKGWAHYAMFVVFLTVKILHNIGVIGD